MLKDVAASMEARRGGGHRVVIRLVLYTQPVAGSVAFMSDS